MLNSSKVMDSPRLQKNGIQSDKHLYAKDESVSGFSRSFAQPKITSTPMRRDSLFATPPKPHILSPHRYSLSDIATPPRICRRDPIKSSFYHNSTGPLLANTNFNVSVSTYEETKSPGLAGRIVQYNEETEREKERKRLPTHQAKYSSPGLFPVVHLFKKKLPILEQKAKRVTIKIASPEYLRYYSQDYNRKLTDSLVRPSISTSIGSTFSQANGESSIGTRSVLDALKEISRKRIHSHEEYEVSEDNGKRQKTELLNGADSNKRSRDDSPLLDCSTSPSKQVSKKVCMYDEYAASCSSTDFSLNKSDFSGSKRKSVSTNTLTENPKESKLVKVINAETQTPNDEQEKIVEETQESREKKQENSQNDPANDSVKLIKKRDSPLKIFDDAPLERIRKNRLAALMGSLTGKDPILTPKPTMSSILNGDIGNISSIEIYNKTDLISDSKTIEKPLVSILSSSKKSPQKSDKHVHFSIPESTSQTSNTTSTMYNSSSVTSTVTETITTTTSSVSETSTPFSVTKTKLETPAPPSSPVNLLLGHTESTIAHNNAGTKKTSTSIAKEPPKTNVSIIGFQFNSSKSTESNASTPINSFRTPTTTIALNTKQLSYGSAITDSVPTVTSPSKVGGFKFDLSKPNSTIGPSQIKTTITSGTPNFSFENPTVKSVENKTQFMNTATASSEISLGNKISNIVSNNTSSTTTSIPSGLTFGTSTTSSSLGAPLTSSSATPTFKFASFISETNAKSTSGFSLPTASTTTSTTSFGLTPTFSPNPVIAFGSSNSNINTSTTPAFSFGPPTPSVVATSTTSGFNTTTTTSSFKMPTVSSGFGTPNASSGFGAPTGANVFGKAITTNFETTPSGFGTSTLSNAEGTPTAGGFGTPVPSTGFGISTTSNLGTSTPSAFGTSTTPDGFVMSSSSAASGGFGIPSTCSSGSFGTTSTSAVGSNKTLPTFGATTTTSTFGNSTVNPAFDKSGISTFGQENIQSSFGAPTVTTVTFVNENAFNNTTTTTTSTLFGVTNSGTAFGGKPDGFGASSNKTNIFGGPTVTQGTGFGVPSSGSIFATTTSTTPFGNIITTSAPAFGSSTTPVFSFGAKTINNTFGNNMFGITTTASNAFGSSTTPTFASSTQFTTPSNFGATNVFGTSNTPNFGTATTSAPPPNAFGAANIANFGSSSQGFGAANKAPIFGNSNTTAFGANTTSNPPFGANSTSPAFGSTAPASSFGSTTSTTAFGASSGNSAFLKAQSTGFGSPQNSFGSNGTFGTTQAPTSSSFGVTANPPTTQTSVFSFGTAANSKPGVFSFGGTASGDLPKPNFNFTGGTTSPAFGGNTAFGNAGVPSFTATAAPQFAASGAAAPGMFNIGSGSPSTSRARTQLKAKRRT